MAAALAGLAPALGGAAQAAAAERAAVSPPPRIPVHGAYLGAWVNPKGRYSYGGANEIPQLAKFNKAIGKPVAILHVYTLFTMPFPAETLEDVAQNGSIPLVDWSCASLAEINAGKADATIRSYAEGFRAYGKPAFLRWYWEMNLDSPAHRACGASGHGAAYVAAWRRIRRIFQQAGADNVAFVWCPSAHGDASPWYPGDAYVDWLGADGYDRYHLGTRALNNAFAHFYGQWAGRGKPIMIGETAANWIDQAAYIQVIRDTAPALYPRIKAVMYFDAPGDYTDWSLTAKGTIAFKALADTPYFSFR